MALKDELKAVLNKYSAENNSDTPDFVLAEYLIGCLENFDKAVNARDQWHGFADIGSPSMVAVPIYGEPLEKIPNTGSPSAGLGTVSAYAIPMEEEIKTEDKKVKYSTSTICRYGIPF